MPALLEVHDLVKHFRAVKAVDGVSFSIAGGCCFGLLGPNGAGKTTTVEMLEGLLEPSSGVILYQGGPLGERFRSEAGIMFQATALQDFMTTLEALHMFQRFYAKTAALDDLIERCALQSFLDRDTRKLSGGQRQRLLLAIALVNDPQVLFLDEPTTGLDPQSRRNFWDLVDSIKQQGKTVVMTTHYMEEAYALCDEIAIMDHGRIIAQGSPEDLLAAHFDEVILQLPKSDIANNKLGDALAALAMPAIERDDMIEFLVHDVNTAVSRLLRSGITLNNLRIRERTLEDLFLQLTGRELRA